ncbi:MAG: nucleotidyltransferase family protein [Sedimentibacter sp.]
MSVSAIIMAAGSSIRMNQDKLKMKIKEKCIYQYIFEKINSSKCFNEVIVVAKDHDILKKSIEMGFKTVLNDKSYLGQSQSIRLGILNLSDAEGYMFFTADQPFISEETIKELVNTFEKNPNNITVPCYNGICGSPAIFPAIYKNQLLKLSGDTGGKIIIKDNEDKLIRVNIQSKDELIDIDTMEDYRRVCVEEGD